MKSALDLIPSLVGPVPELITVDWLDKLWFAANKEKPYGSNIVREAYWLTDNAEKCANWMLHNEIDSLAFVGPFRANPFKAGQVVTIPKGAIVSHGNDGEKTVGRTYKVKLESVYEGYPQFTQVICPSVAWAGSGGYWVDLDLNKNPEFVRINT